MFFRDKTGIQVCQLGAGDVMVSVGQLENVSTKECVAVLFGECAPGEIDRALSELGGKKDYEAWVKFKLLFTNTKSIDVVIKELQQAKSLMKGDKK